VYRNSFVFIPATCPRSRGMKSKKSVRSCSVAMEVRLPRAVSGTFLWMISRFVVLPERPGP
jgi:hypothetical protein